jgi:hypothetical protein
MSNSGQTVFNIFTQENRQRGYLCSTTSGAPIKTIGGQVLESIQVGLGVANSQLYSKYYRLPNYNKVKFTFSADLVTSNSIACTVNGTALTATVFATDHLTTMNAFIAKIEALANIRCVLDTADTNNRSAYVYHDGDADVLLTSFAVTLGGSQATISYVYDTQDVLAGVAMTTRDMAIDGNGIQYYGITGTDVTKFISPVVKCDGIWVYSETTVNPNQSVYIRIKDGGAGKAVGQFRTDSDSGTCVLVSGAKWGEVHALGTVRLRLDI